MGLDPVPSDPQSVDGDDEEGSEVEEGGDCCRDREGGKRGRKAKGRGKEKSQLGESIELREKEWCSRGIGNGGMVMEGENRGRESGRDVLPWRIPNDLLSSFILFETYQKRKRRAVSKQPCWKEDEKVSFPFRRRTEKELVQRSRLTPSSLLALPSSLSSFALLCITLVALGPTRVMLSPWQARWVARRAICKD